MKNNCKYHGCVNTSETKSLFRFPIYDEHRLQIWIKHSGNADLAFLTRKELNERRLCEDHFDTRDIVRNLYKNRLVSTAVPAMYKPDAQNCDAAVADVAASLVADTPVKLEPLDAEWPETCSNVYDALLDVVKHEIDDTATEHAKDDEATAFSVARVKEEPSETEASFPADTLNTDERQSGDSSTAFTPEQKTLLIEISPIKHNTKRFTYNITSPNHSGAHTGEKRYACDHCDFKFTHAATLKRHMLTHTGDKPFSCDRCPCTFSRAYELKKHIMTHTGEQPYSCGHCDFKCLNSSQLKSHMVSHTGVYPFNCEHCDYKCTRVHDLKRHMMSHYGKKPYSCGQCGYKCSQVANLKSHMKTHTGEKPYSCDVCDYKCRRFCDLKKHIRTHTGEKPYSCDRCDYKSARIYDLKTHMVIHTREKPVIDVTTNVNDSVILKST